MKNPHTKYFLFPKFHFNHLIFVFFFIFTSLKKGMQIYFELDHKTSIDFIKLYIYDFGDFLSIIPLLIIRTRMKKAKNERNEGQIKIEKTETNKIKPTFSSKDFGLSSSFLIRKKRKTKCDLYRNIFFFTIVDFIAQIATVVFYVIKNEQKLVVKQANLNSTLIFNILAVILFSYFFLHTNNYQHHIFSIIIDIICGIILAVIDFKKIHEQEGDISVSIIFILIRILTGVLYSLDNVIAKIIFLYNFFSTYALLVSKSIIDFIYLIIFSFPFIFFKLQDNDGEHKLVFSMMVEVFDDKKYYYLFPIYMITSFFYNNFCMKIIDEFSPNHFAIAQLFENFGIFIIDLIVYGPDSVENLAIRIIVFIILIFAAFIYNEFFIINICGLSKNTKLFLEYEEVNDIFASGINENDEDNNSEVIELNTYIIKKDESTDNENSIL